MHYSIRFLWLALFLMLGACGGSSEAPQTSDKYVLADTSLVIVESASTGAVVGSVVISSVGDTAITAFSLSGAGSTDFAIDNTGQIIVATTLDFETTASYTLTATATNGAGDSAPVNVTITVSNVAEIVPVLTAASLTVAEGATAGAVLGAMTISRAGDTAITAFSLSGTGNTDFVIDSAGQITVATGLDFETTASYALMATATNGAGDSAPVNITITVSNVAEIVPVLTMTNLTVAEDATAGAMVGAVVISNAGDTAITAFNLSGTDNAAFAIDSAGQVTVATGLDFETTASYALTAAATNGAGDSAPVNVTITVSNVAEIVPILTVTSLTVAEDATAGAVLGSVTVNNAGDTAITAFSLSGTGNADFAIDSAGQITVATGLDFETTASYVLTATATNGAGDSAPVNVTITVSNVAEIVPILTVTSLTVAEDATAGAVLGSVTVNNAGDTAITAFSLSGTGNTDFAIDNAGQITVATGLDFETTASYALMATATNGAGDSAPVNISITVNNVVEALILADTSFVIAESATVGAVVGSVIVNNAGDSTITAFSLSGTGNTDFAIDSAGQITVAAAGLDFETTASYALMATATNSTESSAPVNVTINLVKTGLNDTGIIFGGDHPNGNNATCIGETIAQQDCSQGRDANAGSLTKAGAGDAGFDFSKLDNNGSSLSASAVNWRCVKDNRSGLIWEVKTTGTGLHNMNDRYNWYNTDASTNGGAVGFADDDGNVCHGYMPGDSTSFCNTEAFIARVNAQNLCGATNWRLPTREELRSIVNYNKVAPAIDSDYFPNTVSSFYWSSSSNAIGSDGALAIAFDSGNGLYVTRESNIYVRLVRSEQ